VSEVFLYEHTPNPEKVIARAARLCYSPATLEELTKEIDESDVDKFIQKLFQLGHLSPFEHASVTFGIKCSRACSHQAVRHRIASFSQKSQRYISENNFKFFIPKTIKNSDFKMDYYILMAQIQLLYNKMKETEIPNEDIRYILPNACETLFFVTMNFRELLHFFNVRCCQRAQWEIRYIAMKMLWFARQIAPNIFMGAGPSCYTNGSCPEGKMSCGKFKWVKEIFSDNDKLISESKVNDNEIE